MVVVARLLCALTIAVVAGIPLACSTGSSSGDVAVADAAPAAASDLDVDAAITPVLAIGDGTSGAPCTADADCKGNEPKCLKSLGKGDFPGGYCTSRCRPSQNDSLDRNATCPGVAAVCEPTQGACFAGCTNKQGTRPCRVGYLCASAGKGHICLPDSYSECDLSVRGSCPSGKVCIIVGLDPIGLCAKGCDVFAQACGGSNGADAGPASSGCYPNALGEGHCADVKQQGLDGEACAYVNDCAAGLSCNREGSKSYCRPLCGGASSKPCSNGKTCVDLSTETAVSLLGVCAG